MAPTAQTIRDRYHLEAWVHSLCYDLAIPDASLAWDRDLESTRITAPNADTAVLDQAVSEVRSVLKLLAEHDAAYTFTRSGYEHVSDDPIPDSERGRGYGPDTYMDLLRAPAAVSQLLRRYVEGDHFTSDLLDRLIPLSAGDDPRLFVCGAWSSGTSAQFACQFFSLYTTVKPTEISAGHLGDITFTDEDLLILVSDSGQTGDLTRWFTEYSARQKPWPRITLITSNDQSTLATQISRLPNGKVIPTRCQPDDRSTLATTSTLLQITVLYLLALAYSSRLGTLTSDLLRVRIRGLTRLPRVLASVRQQRLAFERFSRKLVQPMTIPVSEMLFQPKLAMPANPLLYIIADPTLRALLNESAIKFNEHGPLPCYTEDSSRAKYAPVLLLGQNRTSPVLFIIGGMSSYPRQPSDYERTIESSLEFAEFDLDRVDEFIDNLQSKAFALVFSKNARHTPFAISRGTKLRLKFPEGHIHVVQLDRECDNTGGLELALTSLYSTLHLIYYTVASMGIDPELVGIPKNHTESARIALQSGRGDLSPDAQVMKRELDQAQQLLDELRRSDEEKERQIAQLSKQINSLLTQQRIPPSS